jgi:hypothetical protein
VGKGFFPIHTAFKAAAAAEAEQGDKCVTDTELSIQICAGFGLDFHTKRQKIINKRPERHIYRFQKDVFFLLSEKNTKNQT